VCVGAAVSRSDAACDAAVRVRTVTRDQCSGAVGVVGALTHCHSFVPFEGRCSPIKQLWFLHVVA
jgi:hypothetical protein